jgi:hypothetical protein
MCARTRWRRPGETLAAQETSPICCSSDILGSPYSTVHTNAWVVRRVANARDHHDIGLDGCLDRRPDGRPFADVRRDTEDLRTMPDRPVAQIFGISAEVALEG